MKIISKELDSRVINIYKVMVLAALLFCWSGIILDFNDVLKLFIIGCGFGLLAIYELNLLTKNRSFVLLLEPDINQVVYYQLMRYIKVVMIVALSLGITSQISLFNIHRYNDFDTIAWFSVLSIYTYMSLLELSVLKTKLSEVIGKAIIYGIVTILISGNLDAPIMVSGIAILLSMYCVIGLNFASIARKTKHTCKYVNFSLVINGLLAILAGFLASNITRQFGYSGMYDEELYKFNTTLFNILRTELRLVIVLAVCVFIAHIIMQRFKVRTRSEYKYVIFTIWQLPIFSVIFNIIIRFYGYTSKYPVEILTMVIVYVLVNLAVTYRLVFKNLFNTTRVAEGVNNVYTKWID